MTGSLRRPALGGGTGEAGDHDVAGRGRRSEAARNPARARPRQAFARATLRRLGGGVILLDGQERIAKIKVRIDGLIADEASLTL
jgi:hypothetical protein